MNKFVKTEQVKETILKIALGDLTLFKIDAIKNELEKTAEEPYQSYAFCDYCNFRKECKIKHPVVECDSFVGRKVVFVEDN